jgi:uncharacterized membrane protein
VLGGRPSILAAPRLPSISQWVSLRILETYFIGDPDAVGRGWWIWHDGGPYMSNIKGGVPTKNFIG